ncbi:hypothetical protein [Actinophytocola sediminis]
MAVFDGEWWGVWWPWMIVWAVVLAALGSAVAVFVVHRRAARRERHRSPAVNSPFYLDEELVAPLYQFLNKGIDHETIIQTQRDINEITTKAPEILALNRNRETTTETVATYSDKAVAVIARVLDILKENDSIVRVDLHTGEIVEDGALAATGHGGQRRLRLSDLNRTECYVHLSGEYTQLGDGSDSDTVTYTAPLGEPVTTPGHRPHVLVTCHSRWILRDLRAGAAATCLGQVGRWDPVDGSVTIHPLALFQ